MHVQVCIHGYVCVCVCVCVCAHTQAFVCACDWMTVCLKLCQCQPACMSVCLSSCSVHPLTTGPPCTARKARTGAEVSEQSVPIGFARLCTPLKQHG